MTNPTTPIHSTAGNAADLALPRTAAPRPEAARGVAPWRAVLLVGALVAPLAAGPDRASGQVTRLAAVVDPNRGAAAAADPAAQGPEVRRLTVSARAPERPALRDRLLPDVMDRTAGDAAPLYMMAFLQAAAVPEKERTFTPAEMQGLDPKPDGPDKADYYLRTLPFDQLPRRQAEVEQFLNQYSSALDSMDVAARREYCRWGLALRERGFYALLPHLAHARALTDAALLRARLRAARRDYAGAVRSVQPAFALGRDLNEEPVLVQTLVGASIAARSVAAVEEIGRQPGAPNFYWPLANLPCPFARVHEAMVHERAGVYNTLPQLRRIRDPKGGTFTADDWRDLFGGLSQFTGDPGRPPGAADAGAPVVSGLVLYPRAKQYLVDKGTPADRVEALPVATVLARYLVETYEDAYDEMLKWTALPYWQGREGLDRSMRAFDRTRDQSPGNPLLAVIPAVGRAYFQGAKLDRTIAAAQAVEAVRAYAAAHDGRPPARLEDLTDTPAPDDPTTGKPFAYAVDGERVTIDSLAPPGMPPREGLRVEVTVVR